MLGVARFLPKPRPLRKEQAQAFNRQFFPLTDK